MRRKLYKNVKMKGNVIILKDFIKSLENQKRLKFKNLKKLQKSSKLELEIRFRVIALFQDTWSSNYAINDAINNANYFKIVKIEQWRKKLKQNLMKLRSQTSFTLLPNTPPFFAFLRLKLKILELKVQVWSNYAKIRERENIFQWEKIPALIFLTCFHILPNWMPFSLLFNSTRGVKFMNFDEQFLRPLTTPMLMSDPGWSRVTLFSCLNVDELRTACRRRIVVSIVVFFRGNENEM